MNTMKFSESIPISLDRTIAPEIRQIEHFSIAEPERRVMRNGIPLNIIQVGQEDVVRFDLLIKEFPLTDQMIVEVSSVGQYYAALKAGIRFPVLNRIEFDDIKRFNIGMIVVNPTVLVIHEQAIRRYVGKGNGVLVASYPTSASVPQKYQSIPNLMFYIDKK